MKTVTFLALTLCVFAVAKRPRKSSGKRSAGKGSGVLVDSRDGRSYRTIRIGSQVWLAENLNFATGKSWCYDNDAGNCAKWGRLYDWQTAGSACPSGWHLPSDEEWRELAGDDGQGGKTSGTSLKSIEMKGTNATGFNALPGGLRPTSGKFSRASGHAHFWSSTEVVGFDWSRGIDTGKTDYSWYRGFDAGVEYPIRMCSRKGDGLSVRCLKDGP